MPDDAQQRPPGQAQDALRVTFVGFLVSLARTAAVHFGDLPDPATGRRGAADLAAAQQIIDLLGMLDTKTRGNLTPEERQLMEGMLHDLRRRYVEVSGALTAAASPSRRSVP